MSDYKLMFFTDDDHDDLHFMKEITESLGHVAHLFHNGAQLLEALQNQPVKPDIIFLDIHMPMVDGYQIISDIRSVTEYHDIPIIIHSGNCEDAAVTKCYELHANYFVKKANSFNGLKSSLEHVLGKDWKTFKPSREEFIHTPL